MSAIASFAIVLVAVAVLVLFHGRETIGGLGTEQFASFAWLAAVGLFVFGAVARMFRGRLAQAMQALAFWMALIVALVALYSYRAEIAVVGGRIMGEIAPGTAISHGRTVTIQRGMSGEFAIDGAVNGRPVRFLFDTGASTVVLTPEAARDAGLDLAKLDYAQTITTANGKARAAFVLLDRVSVGTITVANVHALVPKPGTLQQSLLGMTFLDRLASYEVSGARLTLRGR